MKKKSSFSKKTGHSLPLVVISHKKENFYVIYFKGEFIGFARSEERAKKIANMALF